MIRCKLLIFLTACTCYAATENVPSPQDQYLYDHIIYYLNGNADRCADIHSFVCENNSSQGSDVLATVKYWEAMDDATTILSSHNTHGYWSIAVEQELYQQCLEYGHENKELVKELKEKVEVFQELLLDVTLKNFKWQKIDHKIAKMGLGNAFFNIKVIRDPSNNRKRIIMIEPPSLLPLTNMLVTLENLKEVDLDTPEWSDKTSIISFLKKIKKNGINLVEEFLTYLIQIIKDTAFLDRSKMLSERMTIREWSKKYNRPSTVPNPPTSINWPETIYHEFYKVNISLSDTEPIIIKNVHYFSRLFNILFETPNDIIGAAVLAKVAVENLRYIDFDFAQYLHRRDRASFCKIETKLYGVSHKILVNLCKDVIHNQDTRKIQEIVYNIVEEVKSTIYNTPFSFAEESYLLSELQDMITHVRFLVELQNIASNDGIDNWSPLSIPEFYEPFKISNNYFDNIIKYREMLKMKELRSLKSPMHTWTSTPFSLVDLHVPANRFVLNVFFNYALLQNNYYKEQVFGTYGAKLATLAYGLLSENKAIDNSYYDYRLRAHPDFIFDGIRCEQSKRTHTEAEENRIVSSTVGLDIAFSAMEKPVSEQANLPSLTNPLSFKSIWKSDQIFFLAYSLAHCDLKNSTLNDIITHSTKFFVSFPYCQSECKYKPFKNMDKNMFLIKL